MPESTEKLPHIYPRHHVRSLLVGAAGRFIQRYERSHGFYEVTRFLRLNARAMIAGSYAPVPYFGGVLWVDIGNDLDSSIFSRGVYEPGTIGIIRRLSSGGFDYVDIGAYIGGHLIAALRARSSRKQKFVAFEPVPETRRVLLHNLAANGFEHDVQVNPVAVAAGEGVIDFYISVDRNPGNNGISPRSDVYQRKYRCETVRLDDCIRAEAGCNLLLKIDAEGSEPAILDGAKTLLLESRQLVIIFEHNTQALELAGQSRTAVLERLHGAGFTVWKIGEPGGQLLPFVVDHEEFCNCLAAKALPDCLQYT